MSQIATVTTRALSSLLAGQKGVAYRVADRLIAAEGSLAELTTPLIRAGNIAVDLTDKAHGAKYPQMFVYVDRIQNTLREKFRTFSGTVQLAVEIRHSQDRLEGLQDRAQLYTEAVLDVLEDCRGEWGEGLCYGGKYEIKFEPVRHGGKNFVQSVRVIVPVDVNIG